jgi:hypothetical integral membrane protein (TIGR02206 family)
LVRTVETFSAMWWQTSGATIMFTLLVLVTIRVLKPSQRDLYAKALGWVLLLWMVIPPLIHAFAGYWHVDYGLPLQWCDFTGGIAGLALLTRRQVLYEMSLFWGITGASTALLTPQFTQGVTWFFLAEFFVSHSMLLTAPLLLSIYGNMRPRAWSWLGALVWLNVVALVVGAFNYVVSANYMFLFEAPTADMPLFKIQWPYYLIGFEIGCLIIFMFIYLFFRATGRGEVNTNPNKNNTVPVQMEYSVPSAADRSEVR